jgi:hypothetical protein
MRLKWRRINQSVRRFFFAFDSPVRRRLWKKKLELANANCSIGPDWILRYSPLSDDQRRQLEAVHWRLGEVGPWLISLGNHQRFEWWVTKAGDWFRS